MKKNDREIKEISEYYKTSQNLLERDDDFSSYVYTIDIKIPVCLSGRANINILDNDKSKNIILFVNVLPTNKKTTIFISSLKENEDYLKLYVNNVLSDGPSFINMIETWMIRGTDHWFIKPSIWNNIEQTRKDKILSDINDLRYNIGTPYTITIFDELKKQIKVVNKNS